MGYYAAARAGPVRGGPYPRPGTAGEHVDYPSHAPKPADGRSLRYTSGHTAEIHPFVKWAGGKGGALPELRKAYPPQLGRSIKKYAEPFVGGGAVLFDVLSRYELSEVFICDSNPQLMNAYRCIRDHADTLIHRLKKLEKSYLSLSSQDRKAFYYEKRERFNGLSRPATIEAAALFVFLNRTCFNGLYRVNGKGRFNVPMGAYKIRPSATQKTCTGCQMLCRASPFAVETTGRRSSLLMKKPLSILIRPTGR